MRVIFFSEDQQFRELAPLMVGYTTVITADIDKVSSELELHHEDDPSKEQHIFVFADMALGDALIANCQGVCKVHKNVSLVIVADDLLFDSLREDQKNEVFGYLKKPLDMELIIDVINDYGLFKESSEENSKLESGGKYEDLTFVNFDKRKYLKELAQESEGGGPVAGSPEPGEMTDNNLEFDVQEDATDEFQAEEMDRTEPNVVDLVSENTEDVAEAEAVDKLHNVTSISEKLASSAENQLIQEKFDFVYASDAVVKQEDQLMDKTQKIEIKEEIQPDIAIDFASNEEEMPKQERETMTKPSDNDDTGGLEFTISETKELPPETPNADAHYGDGDDDLEFDLSAAGEEDSAVETELESALDGDETGEIVMATDVEGEETSPSIANESTDTIEFDTVETPLDSATEEDVGTIEGLEVSSPSTDDEIEFENEGIELEDNAGNDVTQATQMYIPQEEESIEPEQTLRNEDATQATVVLSEEETDLEFNTSSSAEETEPEDTTGGFSLEAETEEQSDNFFVAPEEDEEVTRFSASQDETDESIQFQTPSVEEPTPTQITARVVRREHREDLSGVSEIISHNTDELTRLQATIKNLRDEREHFLSQIRDLSGEKEIVERENLGLRAELDEVKIELTILKKRHLEDIEEYKNKVRLAYEKRDIMEEKVRNLEKEHDLLRNKERIDTNKVKVRETELESQLELVKMDTEAQVKSRDTKILELKRKIDALEFNMENIAIQSQKVKEDKGKLEDKLEKIIKNLRGSIQMLEDDLKLDNDLLEKLKKIDS